MSIVLTNNLSKAPGTKPRCKIFIEHINENIGTAMQDVDILCILLLFTTFQDHRKLFYCDSWAKMLATSKNKLLKTSYLELSTNFRFSGTKSQRQQKLAKKEHSFHNTVLLKKPHSFYKLQLTQQCKYTPTTQINWRQSKTYFWLVSEKHLHCTICKCPRNAFSEHLECIPVNLCSKLFVPNM